MSLSSSFRSKPTLILAIRKRMYALASAKGEWSYTGGTGKLKGIKGKRTYTGKGAPDGSATYDVEGEYELPK